jgi:hypothetical protein
MLGAIPSERRQTGGRLRKRANTIEKGGSSVLKQMETLLERRDLRSADRANMTTMLRNVRKGAPLSDQEKQQLWAYIGRYLGTGEKNSHPG